MLQQNQDPRLAAFVVWVPELGAHEANVAPATTLVPDPRARQFWDPQEVVGRAYGRLFGLNFPAWDVYMLFGPRARWAAAEPPAPAFWMQQLAGVTQAPHLDPVVFAQRAAAMLRQM